MRAQVNRKNLIVPEIELIHLKRQQATPHSTAERAEEKAGLGLLALFAGIFGFFTTPQGAHLLTEQPLLAHQPASTYVFPATLALKLYQTGAAGTHLATAPNKNLGSVLNAAALTQETALMGPAIGIGTAAHLHVSGAVTLASTPLIPALFVAATGIVTLYQSVMLGRSIYYYRHAAQGSALREEYKDKMINHGIQTGVGTALTGVVTALFLTGTIGLMLTPVGFAVAAGVGIAVALGVFYLRHTMAKRAQARTAQIAIEYDKKIAALPAPGRTETRAVRDPIHHTRVATQAMQHQQFKNTYEYVRNYGAVLDTAKKVGTAELRAKFLEIIDGKVRELTRQIQVDISSREEAKRRIKVKALKELKVEVEKTNDSNPTLKLSTIQQIEADKTNKGMFQSFFKATGDVEMIFKAAKFYLTAPEPLVTPKSINYNVDNPKAYAPTAIAMG